MPCTYKKKHFKKGLTSIKTYYGLKKKGDYRQGGIRSKHRIKELMHIIRREIILNKQLNSLSNDEINTLTLTSFAEMLLIYL